MFAITRQPRVLVKIVKPPKQTSFTIVSKLIPKTTLGVTFEPLFTSISSAGDQLGAASSPQWYIMSCDDSGIEVNAWDLCHHLVHEGFGVDGLGAAEFAEPDLEQRWLIGKSTEHAFTAARDCRTAANQDATPPLAVVESDANWFRDSEHSELDQARNAIGKPTDRVRIAHLDTGYDPTHETLPQFLRKDLQRNFVDNGTPNDASDSTSGVLTNLGHGCGTLSLLAGGIVNGSPLGGAPFLEVIPIRVANSVVLFKNSAIAQALDYVHGLFQGPATRVHVITMSMGGLASQAWADAVNALYELGVFVVTAAGNNYGNFPTHNIVYPARFNRVVAACGVMANGKAYADLPALIMAGNYGPSSKMETAMAGFTPNTPWARLGCRSTVDHDGRGTSAATPQIAAAAALWIQKHKNEWEQYPEGWMRVEAVRKALFDSAWPANADQEHLGRGLLRANQALAQQPANSKSLKQQPVDSASFPFLRVITGMGLRATPDEHLRMLELEALQIAQRSSEIEKLLPDPEKLETLSATDQQRLIGLLAAAPGASKMLRAVLAARVAPKSSDNRQAVVPQNLSQGDAARLQLAMNPPLRPPLTRKLRVFAYDPLLANDPDLFQVNQTTLEVAWEDKLQPGPVGEYLEVVDIDPATGCGYAPVDLNHPAILSSGGLQPSESDPRFHQQMVYAVAMKTIQHFERALGRVALWSPRFVKYQQNGKSHIERLFVQRLRIYPHALREANSYYSPDKKALLFGYFSASATDPGENLPGGSIFCCLSHDIIAHETTHALLDGLHRYFGEPSNEDVLAFHEAFADIVALFQHFTIPEALCDQIARTRGDLSRQSLLGELALQFGQGIGGHGALRNAIGQIDQVSGQWKPAEPKPTDYQNATEPHDRGAVLVAAIFDAFLDIYNRRSRDLIRLASGGTGVLPDGAITHDLVSRLAREASKTAGHMLNICIRALDYCPPVDIRFGEYLRALITADRDLVPDDPWGYRPAIIQGFRRRGIYPDNVRTLSTNSLCWEEPELPLELEGKPEGILRELRLDWNLRLQRQNADEICRDNCFKVWEWLNTEEVKQADLEALGVFREPHYLPPGFVAGKSVLRPFEVHSVRPARRIGPDGQQRLDLVIEITQSWLPDGEGGDKYRGGCTLIIDLDRHAIRYVLRKRVANPERVQAQAAFRKQLVGSNLAANYLGYSALTREPFAMMHRAF